MSSKQNQRAKAEKEYKLISQLLLNNDTKGIKRECDTKEFAEQRISALENYWNFNPEAL